MLRGTNLERANLLCAILEQTLFLGVVLDGACLEGTELGNC